MDFIKDLAPTIIGIFALLLSYYSISAQIRKNHCAQWIKDFRKEIALFNYHVYLYIQDEEAFDKVQRSAHLVQMFLDDNNELHLDLNAQMDKMVDRAMFIPDNKKKLGKTMEKNNSSI